MNRPQCSVDELELIALSDGELTENRARELRDHLPPAPGGCADCAGRLARLGALAAQLRAPVPEADDAGFVDAVERRLPAALPQPPRGAGRARLLLAVSGVASLVIVLALVPRERRAREFGARGTAAPWHDQVASALDVVAAHPAAGAPLARPLTAGARLHPGDGIAVSARNGHAETPVYLMVFAVDARGEVHWIVPAWSDPAETPRSVRLPPGGALPEPAGRTPEAPAPGKLRVMTLLSRAPLDVRAVEAALERGRPLAPGEDRHLRTVEVQMAAPP